MGGWPLYFMPHTPKVAIRNIGTFHGKHSINTIMGSW